MVDQVLDVLVRDWSRFAAIVIGKPTTTKEQAEHCIPMMRRPMVDAVRFRRVWVGVLGQRDAYRMSP